MYPCQIPGCDREVQIRSTIKTGPYTGKKACPQHAAEYNTVKKKPKPIKKITEKTQLKKKERSSIRDLYFHYHLQKITHSEEDYSPIPSPTTANCCHLLPKSSHPSVQSNLDNVVYLTLDQHTKFDNLLMTANFNRLEKEFPRSWPIVCSRLRKVIPLCTERTKLYFKLEEYLKEKT
jgi:hypothetical protein